MPELANGKQFFFNRSHFFRKPTAIVFSEVVVFSRFFLGRQNFKISKPLSCNISFFESTSEKFLRYILTRSSNFKEISLDNTPVKKPK